MAAGDLVVGPFQVELQGVLMDALACDGLIVSEWLSGFGVPQGRVSVVPRPMRHGLFAGPQYMDGRVHSWSVVASAGSWADLLAEQTDLGTAFSPVPDTDTDYVVPLVYTLGDGSTKYRVNGIPTRAEWGYARALRTLHNGGFAPTTWNDGALCEFLATDPLIYEDTLQSATATLGVSSGGLALPHGFPHAFGTATSGAAVCVNGGNATTFPTITVLAGGSGASGITLLNDTTGEDWSITLTLSAGDTLVVDMAANTVLLNGTADRAPFVNRPGSVWFGLPSGTSNVTLQATGAGTTASVEWRDAFLI